MPGFNSKELRKANSITLAGADGSFKACLAGGFELGFSAKLGSLLGDVSSFGETYNNIASAANFLISKSGGRELPVGIDIPRKAIYGGSTPLKFTLHTFLFIEESYEKDIQGPLNQLIKWVLPESSSSEALKAINEAISAKADAGADAWSIAQKMFNLAEQYLGEIKKLTPPKALNEPLTLTIGDPCRFKYEQVLLMSFRVRVPPFFYSDGAPAPDHVDVDLDIETMRVASVGNVKF